MERIFIGVLCFGGAAALAGTWGLYLFAAQPDCISSFEAAKQSIIFALSPGQAGTWVFIYTLVSVFICLVCGTLIFQNRLRKIAMSLVACHSIAAFFVYTSALVLAIALPMLLLTKEGKNA